MISHIFEETFSDWDVVTMMKLKPQSDQLPKTLANAFGCVVFLPWGVEVVGIVGIVEFLV